jgi:hypothetical protein
VTVAVSPLGPIQQALYERLTDDAELMGLVSGVFDHVPEGTQRPYVVVGEATSIPDNRHGGFGRQSTATLHIWTRERGFRTAQQIEDRIVQLLDHQPLGVDGLHTVAVRFEFSQTLVDPEPPGDIRHIPIRFRVITEQE